MLFLGFSLMGCGPKKYAAPEVSASPKNQIAIKFYRENEDGSRALQKFALIDPWELAKGEQWGCIEQDESLPYIFVAIVGRIGNTQFVFGVFHGRRGINEVAAGFTFSMTEETNGAVNLLLPSLRSISYSVVSKSEADEFRKNAKDAGAELLECKKSNEMVIQHHE